ncbi:hypothetical protein AB1Y20_018928 [Prymnesium parvum]|uniref:Uncharacterized protein n=1 Tax=Prymnesium parvum TaxID=97485 RepID=A0AB34JQX1_PRYPA
MTTGRPPGAWSIAAWMERGAWAFVVQQPAPPLQKLLLDGAGDREDGLRVGRGVHTKGHDGELGPQDGLVPVVRIHTDRPKAGL